MLRFAYITIGPAKRGQLFHVAAALTLLAAEGIHALAQAPPERFAESSGRGYNSPADD